MKRKPVVKSAAGQMVRIDRDFAAYLSERAKRLQVSRVEVSRRLLVAIRQRKGPAHV